MFDESNDFRGLMKNNAWPCRVCGLDMGQDCWGGDENLNFRCDICDCCGAEAGVNDFNTQVVKNYREKWIQGGCQ